MTGMHSAISIITLSVNGLNNPKRDWQTGFLKNHDLSVYSLHETSFRFKEK